MNKKVFIANNLKDYLRGKSDGIMFLDVCEEDVKLLEELAKKYNKQIEIKDVNLKSPTDAKDLLTAIEKRLLPKMYEV